MWGSNTVRVQWIFQFNINNYIYIQYYSNIIRFNVKVFTIYKLYIHYVHRVSHALLRLVCRIAGQNMCENVSESEWKHKTWQLANVARVEGELRALQGGGRKGTKGGRSSCSTLSHFHELCYVPDSFGLKWSACNGLGALQLGLGFLWGATGRWQGGKVAAGSWQLLLRLRLVCV